MNNLSRWAIHNPIPTIVLFVVLMIAGLYGYGQLRINSNPDIDIPTVTVSVAVTGASPTELEPQVAKQVENAVAGLDGIDTISSSLSDGSSTASAQFVLGTDLNRAKSDVQNAVNGIQGDLPGGAISTVRRVESTGNSIIDYVVDIAWMSPEQLSWYVDNDLARTLLGVSGVGSIKRAGGVDRVISVRLDPARLSALGISAAQVSTALADTNINKPGGRVTLGDQENSVRTLGSAGSLQTLADTRIALNGTTYRVADLGTVEDTWSDPRQAALYNGKSVVAFSVYRSVGSGEMQTTKAVRTKIEQIRRDNPNVTITEVSSSSDFVQESYDAAVESLVIGVILSIGIVLLFLRDIRATLVSAVAIPLSLIPTFAVMWMMDQSLNAISLLALSLVVGILIDDAIVEIENIVRHMRESGKSAFQAALEAADEIGVAVVATTATLIAIFVPVAFMPGIAGQFFKSFGIAVAVSVFFSLIVARMVTLLMGLTPLIAILMLMGIAAKNSILLVEYALVAVSKGKPRFDALIEAAAKRARPIVMTSIAMGAAMAPIALGFGADAATRAPMAIAVIGGLVSSTLLSLVYVPVVYTFMDDLQGFLGHWLGKLLVENPERTAAATSDSHEAPDEDHAANVVSLLKAAE